MKDGKDNMKDNMKENIKPEKRGALLAVKGLSAGVEDKEILSKVDLMIGRGESHVLMGPNGAGKSTLGHVLMGDPLYHVISGKIVFGGTDITAEPADKRAKAGMFLSFQDPLEVPGLSLESFLRSAVEQKTGEHIRLWDFKKEMHAAMDVLQMDYSYAERDLGV